MKKKKGKRRKHKSMFELISHNPKTEKMINIWSSVLIYLVATIVIGMLFVRPPITGFAGGDDEIAPVMYEPVPENNSYAQGGDRSVSVKINESDLDESTVKLYIKAKESISWDEYPMTCVVMGETECESYGATVSLDIVGSDTIEQYYFVATDNSENTGYLGSAANPLIFTVDINPSEILFLLPENNTYISGNTTVELEVTDVSSGVNSSSVKYSFDNETWTDMSGSGSSYSGWFNSTQFSDNESVIIYAKAVDNITNVGYEWINVSVDNTKPAIEIIEPSESETLSGIEYFEINTSDIHSGIDTSSVYVSIGSSQRSMDCTESDGRYVCTEYFDTSPLSDGGTVVTFTSEDIAGNSNTSEINVTIDNDLISVSITNPEGGSYINDHTYINASVSNAEGKVSGLQLNITGPGYSTQESMTCSADYKCYSFWNVSQLSEGAYTIFVNVSNTADTLVNTSITLTVDRTGPELQIDLPATTKVNGTISTRVVITDVYGVDPDTVKFNISNYSKATNCARYIQGKKYICAGNFNTTLIDDGTYSLVFYGSDLAGNSNYRDMALIVDNVKDSGEDDGSDQTSSTTSTSTTVPESAPTGGLENIITSIFLAFENIGELLKEWPVQALAISMIIFIVIVAIFRHSQIIEFLKRSEKAKERGEKK
jgi:hypothetical protein